MQVIEQAQLCMGCMELKGNIEVCPKCSWSDTFSLQPQFYLTPRTVLMDRFLIGRALGYGGCAVTYLAWDAQHQTRVVIKEYLPGGLITRTFGNPIALILTPDLQPIFDHGLSLFVREVEALHNLGAIDFLASSLATFRQNGTAYHVTEWLDGMDFTTYLKRHPSGLRPEIAMRMLLPAVDGLAFVHKAGLLHENIAPANIFLTTSAQVKILDFGHARRFLRRQVPKLEFGIKDGFAAEEQYRPDGSIGPWTDMYSMGAVFYLALTGRTPPPAPDRMARDTMPPLPGSYTGMHGTVMRSMQPHASQRFATMDDFRAALTGLPQAPPLPMPAQNSPRNVISTLPAPIPPVPSLGQTPHMDHPAPAYRDSGNDLGRGPRPVAVKRRNPIWIFLLLAIAVLALVGFAMYIVLDLRVTGNSSPFSRPREFQVNYFEAQPSAVAVGVQARLRWHLEGAESITINGVPVLPKGEANARPGSYQLIAYDHKGVRHELTQVVQLSPSPATADPDRTPR